jgi:hypothetical protein
MLLRGMRILLSEDDAIAASYREESVAIITYHENPKAGRECRRMSMLWAVMGCRGGGISSPSVNPKLILDWGRIGAPARGLDFALRDYRDEPSPKALGERASVSKALHFKVSSSNSVLAMCGRTVYDEMLFGYWKGGV